jgi:GT2 family glycosyltransferase
MNGLRRNDGEGLPGAGTKKEPQVAIVILNWNGKAYLQQFLPFVLASTYQNKRVIVADNASTDGSLQYVQEKFPGVEIIANPTNEGFAKGYNTALRQVATDYYVLLNSDVEVTPAWIEPVIALMESDGRIGACQPKLLDYQRRNFFEYAGACGGWLDSFGYPFTRGRVFEDIETDQGQYENAAECFWSSGAAFFVRAGLYHELGGLDEYFFAHQEEIDLCWRIQLAGYKIFVQPASVVYHVGGGTLAKESPHKSFLNFRNNLVMCTKNWPVGVALWKIPLRLMLDAVAAWKGLAEGKPAFFGAICKSHVYYVRWLFFERGRSIFPAKKNGRLRGYYSGLIVWDYFIKKKKTFSEIVKDK